MLLVLLCLRGAAASFAVVIIGHKLRQRDIGWASDRARTRWWKHAEVATPGPPVLGIQSALPASYAVRCSGDRVAVRAAALGRGISILGSALEQDATLLRTVRRRWRKAASYWRESPLLDVGLDEVEACLAEVDVDSGRTVGADSREEVLRLETVDNLLELLAIAGEEDSARSRSVSDAYNVTLNEGRAIGCCVEGLVVPPRAVGLVRNRVFVEACFRQLLTQYTRALRRTYLEA